MMKAEELLQLDYGKWVDVVSPALEIVVFSNGIFMWNMDIKKLKFEMALILHDLMKEEYGYRERLGEKIWDRKVSSLKDAMKYIEAVLNGQRKRHES